MEVSAQMIKELKEKTGAGVVDCKQVLIETNGNMERAVTILREKGLSKAAKKEGRQANEGTVVYKVDGKKGLVLKVNCETDFVAKTDDFKAACNEALELVFKNGYAHSVELPAELETVRKNIVAKVGENILIPDWKFINAKGELFPYVHLGKVAVIVDFELGGGKPSEALNQIMKNIAMQITAMDPISIDSESVPAEKVAEMKDIFTDEAKQTGKPEKVIENIIKGKFEKYYAEKVLLEQPYILEEDKKVKTVIEEFNKANGGSLKVNAFVRISL